MLDDIVVGREDPIGQPVVAHELLDIFNGIEFRRSPRQEQQGDGLRDNQFGR